MWKNFYELDICIENYILYVKYEIIGTEHKKQSKSDSEPKGWISYHLPNTLKYSSSKRKISLFY